MTPADDKHKMHAPATGWIFIALVAAVIGFWFYWAVRHSNGAANPMTMLDDLRELASHGLAPFAVIPLFIAGSLLVAPIYGMIAVCALVFEPRVAIVAATAGTMVATAITHWIGGHFGRAFSHRVPTDIAGRIYGIAASADVWSIAGLQLLPIAPFTVLNALVGAAGVKLRIFLAGTFITMVPTVVLICLSVDRARAALSGEPIFDLWTGVAIMTAGLVLIALRIWQKRGETS